ncbi:SCO3374 family protein [Streptomyces sp. HB2AG]|uniref:SCO3374 family protein n=1 Tax=Streptomyces sp. HB2AG TaxID=2983400 RepID=UPI0022AAA31C|nr:SCO3374 family protein [Streptomyces sp. HB2AG]MCZ2526789.1 SCO3374 family protein [Streptomyces sp. HB2AG]
MSATEQDAADAAAWYGARLGWPAAPGPGGPGSGGPGPGPGRPRLATGVRFDVLEVPAAAGDEVLGRLPGPAAGPVVRHGARMRLLVAPGAAEELPGLLDWLEWGGVALDLVALGRGGSMPVPALPGAARGPGEPFWVRPPLARRGGEGDGDRPVPLPALAGPPGCPGHPGPARAWGTGGGAPDLVRLVAALATACHRVRLFPPPGRRTARNRQAWAFS